jgi:hypothetical protein
MCATRPSLDEFFFFFSCYNCMWSHMEAEQEDQKFEASLGYLISIKKP